MRCRLSVVAVVMVALAYSDSGAQDKAAFKSGPAPKGYVGGPFQAYTVNGKRGKDRFHCPVLEFGLDPVIGIFVREGDTPPADDAAVLELLKKADEAVKRHDELSFLKSFAVFVTPEARSSINQAKIDDVDTLIKQSGAREKLERRLRAAAKPLEHVIVGYVGPDQLPKWELAKEPGVTVLVYAKHKVLENYAFPEGKLTSADTDAIMKRVDELMKERRKGKK
jgi:hypothetical protein